MSAQRPWRVTAYFSSKWLLLQIYTCISRAASTACFTISTGYGTNHDNSEWHGEAGHSAKEGRGSYQGEGTGIDPLPEAIRGYASVQVNQQPPESSPIQAARESTKKHNLTDHLT